MTNAPNSLKTHVIIILGTNEDGDVLSDMMFCVAPSKSTLSKCSEALALAAPHLGLHHAPKAAALQKP